jgi:hypothetical protein
MVLPLYGESHCPMSTNYVLRLLDPSANYAKAGSGQCFNFFAFYFT